MRLEEFPRPKDDNGRGVHWSASVYHPSGSELDFWLQELQAMQIKWVKLLDDGGSASMELCQRLLEADIMPVVRLYREAPNPGHISGREEETVRRLDRRSHPGKHTGSRYRNHIVHHIPSAVYQSRRKGRLLAGFFLPNRSDCSCRGTGGYIRFTRIPKQCNRHVFNHSFRLEHHVPWWCIYIRSYAGQPRGINR